MKIVKAILDIRVFVDCPGCNDVIDLMDEGDTSGCNHNDDGHILDQACPNNNKVWVDTHRGFEVEDVKCSECGTIFNVKTLEW